MERPTAKYINIVLHIGKFSLENRLKILRPPPLLIHLFKNHSKNFSRLGRENRMLQ